MRIQNNMNYGHPNFGVKIINEKDFPIKLYNSFLDSPIVQKLDEIAPEATVELRLPPWPVTEYTLSFDTHLDKIDIKSPDLKHHNIYNKDVTQFYICKELNSMIKELKSRFYLDSFLSFRNQCKESNKKYNK